jgi:hypothetical protein
MDMAEAQSIGHVVLAGDLNARTAQLSDTADDTITDSVEEELGLDAITLTASQLSIDSRNNTDPAVPNAAGKRFIQLCQATELVICNGRAAGDEVGATTSIGTRRNGKSVVDYFAVHMELFPRVLKLAVEDATPTDMWQHGPLESGLDHRVLRLHVAVANEAEAASAPQPPTQPAELPPSHVPAVMPMPERLIITSDVSTALANEDLSGPPALVPCDLSCGGP